MSHHFCLERGGTLLVSFLSFITSFVVQVKSMVRVLWSQMKKNFKNLFFDADIIGKQKTFSFPNDVSVSEK